MLIHYDLQSLRETIDTWKKDGTRVAFVPTMGNLHDGHLSLLEKAKALADRTVVSIFVNPIQFSHGEDYKRYPSTLDEDADKLRARGLDLLFAPDLAELYPGGMDEDTRVTVPYLSSILCGRFRPGHFSGVATVVTKLFINVRPDMALFGEKDYQQLLVIRRMVRDLCLPVEIIGTPIVREDDGLAMSSRNAYLSPEERSRAGIIYRTLKSAADDLRAGAYSVAEIEARGMQVLSEAGLEPEYFSIRRSADLGEPEQGDRELTILTAAWLGPARLIDNIHVVCE